jgi:radical SAM protein with 4Fe4S-binding SPASM domain
MPRFSKLFLEITSACNFSCAFCPPTRRPSRFLSREEFELRLERLEGYGKLLYFHVKGEPLLHPEFGTFLGLAAERGFEVCITTNGSLVEARAAELLGAKNIRKLSISLHSNSGAGPEELAAYWRGVAAFLDLHRADPAFPVSLRLWNRRSGRLPPEAEALWELLRGRYALAEDFDAAASGDAAIRLDDKVYLNQAEEFAWPDPGLPEIAVRGSCHGLRNQIGILVDGSVVPCCLDGEGVMALGNIMETPLSGILASPRARAIREGFSRGELVEHLCRTCGYRQRFTANK